MSYQNTTPYPDAVNVPDHLIPQNVMSASTDSLNSHPSGSRSAFNSPLRLDPRYNQPATESASLPTPGYGNGAGNGRAPYKNMTVNIPGSFQSANYNAPYPSETLSPGGQYNNSYYDNASSMNGPSHQTFQNHNSVPSPIRATPSHPLHYQSQPRVFVPPNQRPQNKTSQHSNSYPHHQQPPYGNQQQQYHSQGQIRGAGPPGPEGYDNYANYSQRQLPIGPPQKQPLAQNWQRQQETQPLYPQYSHPYAQRLAQQPQAVGNNPGFDSNMNSGNYQQMPVGQQMRLSQNEMNGKDFYEINNRDQMQQHLPQMINNHTGSGHVPRRVVTSPESNLANPLPIQKREKELKNRTKSMTSSAQTLASQTPTTSTTQRTPSTSSTHSFSFTSKSRSLSSLGMLSSLSKKGNGINQRDRVASHTSVLQKNAHALQHSRKPSVYPAILSRVAKQFKENTVLNINMKDGLEYHDSFTGKEAIDLICDIIRTNDRNLALLMGRALDAQKFFHDVTYNHRLRDSNSEVYAFTRVFSDVEFYADENGHPGLHRDPSMSQLPSLSNAPYPTSPLIGVPASPIEENSGSFTNLNKIGQEQVFPEQTGVNGVFTILSECYSPTCTRNRLCYSIACPRRLEQQARLNLKPRGGLRKAVSRLSLHDTEASKTLWHETVDQSVLDKLDKHEKMRQELIYELIYTERDYVKDLEFMTDFYIMPLRNPINNIIPERERDAFIRTVFGGVSELLRLAKSLSEALTARQQAQKPVVESIGDVILLFIGNFDPFIKYSGNKVFASFEHERQQQVNVKYARFLEAIEKKPESRKQDFSSFLIKGIQRPARYQLLLSGILKNTKEDSPDYANLVKAKEEIEKVLVRINLQTGEATDRHKIMVLHRLLGRQTLEERFNFKLNYNNRIIYQVTLSRKRDNEKIDLYLFEHALLLIKHKIQNKREVHKVFESPIYLPLLFVNSGYETPTFKLILSFREDGSIVSDAGLKAKQEISPYNPVSSSSQQKLQLNFFGLGTNPVHVSLFADDLTHQNQILLQIQLQQKRLIEKYDIFSLAKYETRRFTGNNRINCAVPCYGGKKLLYGTDSGVWVSTVRSISMTSNEKICSDPTMVISKPYVTQMEVLVEYSKILVLSDKILYEFDLTCTDSLDHAKNTRSGKVILSHVTSFKTGVCDGKLLVCAMKSGLKSISIVEPTNPFDNKNKNRSKRPEVREISFSSDPVSISFLKTKLCIGCTKGFEILSLEAGRKEPILDRADPSLDFATQRETVSPLSIHRLDKNFLLSYSEFSFLINRNGWRTKHDWGIFWEGTPQNIALFYPYLLAFDPGFIEIRDLESTNLIRALVGENIRFLHSNEHEALYACEENGYDIIVSIDFLNLKPKAKKEVTTK